MQTHIQTGLVSVQIENKIATITFAHPASNSLPRLLLDQLTTALEKLSNQVDVAIIVLKSNGDGVFCAGASFDELLAVNNITEGTHFFSGFANLLNAMRKCSKLIIGRIQGKAVGGGVGIIAACDYSIATPDAAIKLSELAIGIGPFVIEPAVSRKIGKMAMAEMTLTPNEWKTADWANKKGLFTKMASSQVALDIEITTLSHKLACYNPEALLQIKKMFWEGTQDWDTLLYKRAAISGQLILSDFAKKALPKK